MSVVAYDGIVKAASDRFGELRLYRRRRFALKLVAFHPEGEWLSVEFTVDGTCHVLLRR